MSTTIFPGPPLSIPYFTCEYRANRPSQVPVHAPTDRASGADKAIADRTPAEQVKDSIEWPKMQGGAGIGGARRPEWIPFPCLAVAGQDTVDPRDNRLKAFS